MTTYQSRLGDTVEDIAHRKIGEVMGFVGGYVRLRPIGGGIEWETKPEELRPVTSAEVLSARVADVNARSRGGLP
jgi:hypothetical protein